MIERIVDRCHVSESNIAVIRYVISRLKNGYDTFRELPRNQRRDIMRIAIKRHEGNRRLYVDVMRGFIPPSIAEDL